MDRQLRETVSEAELWRILYFGKKERHRKEWLMGMLHQELFRLEHYNTKANLSKNVVEEVWDVVESTGDWYTSRALKKYDLLSAKERLVQPLKCEPGVYICLVEHCFNSEKLLRSYVVTDSKERPRGCNYHTYREKYPSEMKEMIIKLISKELKSVVKEGLQIKEVMPDKRISYLCSESDVTIGLAPLEIIKEVKRRIEEGSK